MSEQGSAELIDRVLREIAEDDIAAPIADAVKSAWDGQRFDDEALAGELVRLSHEAAGA